jgi:uncharacterized DUF497 family protein
VIYEWDPAKATVNLRAHRVSFGEAATVFLDPLAITFPDADHSDEEDREITIGFSKNPSSSIRITLPARRPCTDHQRAKGDSKGAQTV